MNLGQFALLAGVLKMLLAVSLLRCSCSESCTVCHPANVALAHAAHWRRPLSGERDRASEHPFESCPVKWRPVLNKRDGYMCPFALF